MSPSKLARLAVKDLFGEFERMLVSIGKFILGVLIVACSLSTAYALPSDVTNPQGALWNLLESSRTQEAFVLEEQLKKILVSEPIRTIAPLGGGVSSSWLVQFENNVVAVLKGDDPDVERAAPREAAAYVVDRALGLHMVPLTVVRNINGREYSLQLYYPHANTEALVGRGVTPEFATSRHADMGLFDYMIFNLDRDRKIVHNVVSGSEGRLIGIDHARSFFSAHEFDLDLKQTDLEAASLEFRDKLNRLDLVKFSDDLKGFLSQEQIQDVKKRVAVVKLNLEGNHLQSYPQVAERKNVSRPFVLPEELRARTLFAISQIERILQTRTGEDPFELLTKFTSFGSIERDARYIRILSDWHQYTAEEKVLFLKLLVETQARANLRATIPMAVQSLLKKNIDDLPLLEKAMPPELLKSDYAYFLADVSREQNLSQAQLKYLRKMLWSDAGSKFVRIFMVNADLPKINPAFKKMWAERVVVGLERGELAVEDARLILTQQRLSGLKNILEIETRPGRKERVVSLFKKQIQEAFETAPLKNWSEEYIEKLKTTHATVLNVLNDFSRPRNIRCEGLF